MKKDRNKDARARAEARRIAMRECVSSLEDLGPKLGTLSALIIDGRYDHARRMVETTVPQLVESLSASQRTAVHLRMFLKAPQNDMPDWSTPLHVNAAWVWVQAPTMNIFRQLQYIHLPKLARFLAKPWSLLKEAMHTRRHLHRVRFAKEKMAMVEAKASVERNAAAAAEAVEPADG